MSIFREKTLDILGLSISPDWVDVIRLKRTANGLALSDIRRVSVTALREEHPTRHEATVAALSKLNSEKGFTSGELITCLRRHEVTTRVVTLPSTDDAEIREMVRLGADQYVPYPVEDLVIDYLVIQELENGYSRVMVVVAHRPVVENLLAILHETGLEPDVIGISSMGLLNCDLYSNRSQSAQRQPDDVRALVNVQESELDLCVAKGDQPVFTRGISLETLEASTSLGSWAEDVLTEVGNSLTAYHREPESKHVSKFILYGDPGRVEPLVHSLQERFGAEVHQAQPFATITIEGANLVSGAQANLSSALACPLGLCLGHAMATGKELNLIPQSLQLRRQARQRRKLLLTTAASSIAVVTLITLLGFVKHRERQAYLELLNEETREMEPVASLTERKEERVNVIKRQLATGDSSLQLLAESFKIAPSEVALTGFWYKRAEHELAIEGLAVDRASAIDFADLMRQSPLIHNVRVGDTEKRRVYYYYNRELTVFRIFASF